MNLWRFGCHATAGAHHGAVTFSYKTDLNKTPQFGLIAEEVAAISPDLVVRNAGGEIYTVRYDPVNIMLLNEFLKEHDKVEKHQQTITRLDAEIRSLKATLKEQAALIHTVRDELNRNPVGQPVVNYR